MTDTNSGMTFEPATLCIARADSEAISSSTPWKPERGDQGDWVRAMQLARGSRHSIFVDLGEPRHLIMQRIVAYGLPHVPYVSLPLSEFLSNPQKIVELIPCDSYIIYVEPKHLAGGRLKRYKFVAASALPSIADDMKASFAAEDCIVTVLVVLPLKMHGAAIVDSTGLIATADFVPGDSPHVSRPGITPKWRAWQEPWTETFRYSFDDPAIRSTLFHSLQTALPREHATARFGQPLFLPGYYEIVICPNKHDSCEYFLHDLKPWKFP